jgi:hypothetical protein
MTYPDWYLVSFVAASFYNAQGNIDAGFNGLMQCCLRINGKIDTLEAKAATTLPERLTPPDAVPLTSTAWFRYQQNWAVKINPKNLVESGIEYPNSLGQRVNRVMTMHPNGMRFGCEIPFRVDVDRVVGLDGRAHIANLRVTPAGQSSPTSFLECNAKAILTPLPGDKSRAGVEITFVVNATSYMIGKQSGTDASTMIVWGDGTIEVADDGVWTTLEGGSLTVGAPPVPSPSVLEHLRRCAAEAGLPPFEAGVGSSGSQREGADTGAGFFDRVMGRVHASGFAGVERFSQDLSEPELTGIVDTQRLTEAEAVDLVVGRARKAYYTQLAADRELEWNDEVADSITLGLADVKVLAALARTNDGAGLRRRRPNTNDGQPVAGSSTEETVDDVTFIYSDSDSDSDGDGDGDGDVRTSLVPNPKGRVPNPKGKEKEL